MNSTFDREQRFPPLGILPKQEPDRDRPKSTAQVGALLPLSDSEHLAHINTCRYLMQLARARLRGSHSPQDAIEVRRWSEAMDEAILARQAAAIERQAQDEACFDGSWALELARVDVNPAAVRRRISRMA